MNQPNPQKYLCAICGKKFLASIRPPIRWQDKVKVNIPEMRPGETLIVCGSQLMRKGPFVCGEQCLNEAQKQVNAMYEGVEEDLKAVRGES